MLVALYRILTTLCILIFVLLTLLVLLAILQRHVREVLSEQVLVLRHLQATLNELERHTDTLDRLNARLRLMLASAHHLQLPEGRER